MSEKLTNIMLDAIHRGDTVKDLVEQELKPDIYVRFENTVEDTCSVTVFGNEQSMDADALYKYDPVTARAAFNDELDAYLEDLEYHFQPLDIYEQLAWEVMRAMDKETILEIAKELDEDEQVDFIENPDEYIESEVLGNGRWDDTIREAVYDALQNIDNYYDQ